MFLFNAIEIMLTPLFNSVFLFRFSSLELDVSQRVFKQRIVDIEKEYERKYNDAKEQLKHDARLTVDAIISLDEKDEKSTQ